ncbi:hypothetical protein F5148DRAFT_1296433 [Russula earlei]|uniref:Uncharacterized protein n=1 Tax=Russula earlei TaxID=71964 RepID=A0ACC0TR03_9AGAM|nr:hypothetical protein F5148DRAFT_1296433 [Russula earlei]
MSTRFPSFWVFGFRKLGNQRKPTKTREFFLWFADVAYVQSPSKFQLHIGSRDEKPFPQLTSLYIWVDSEKDAITSLPLLRQLYVGKFLQLWLIPDSGDISPQDWVTALSVMLSTPYPTSRLPPPLARCVLPFLTKLVFEGDLARALVPCSPVSPHWLPRLVAHSPDSMQALFSPVFSLTSVIYSFPSGEQTFPLGSTYTLQCQLTQLDW